MAKAWRAEVVIGDLTVVLTPAGATVAHAGWTWTRPGFAPPAARPPAVEVRRLAEETAAAYTAELRARPLFQIMFPEARP